MRGEKGQIYLINKALEKSNKSVHFFLLADAYFLLF